MTISGLSRREKNTVWRNSGICKERTDVGMRDGSVKRESYEIHETEHLILHQAETGVQSLW